MHTTLIQRKEIRSLARNGKSYAEISEILNIPAVNIAPIARSVSEKMDVLNDKFPAALAQKRTTAADKMLDRINIALSALKKGTIRGMSPDELAGLIKQLSVSQKIMTDLDGQPAITRQVNNFLVMLNKKRKAIVSASNDAPALDTSDAVDATTHSAGPA